MGRCLLKLYRQKWDKCQFEGKKQMRRFEDFGIGKTVVESNKKVVGNHWVLYICVRNYFVVMD